MFESCKSTLDGLVVSMCLRASAMYVEVSANMNARHHVRDTKRKTRQREREGESMH